MRNLLLFLFLFSSTAFAQYRDNSPGAVGSRNFSSCMMGRHAQPIQCSLRYDLPSFEQFVENRTSIPENQYGQVVERLFRKLNGLDERLNQSFMSYGAPNYTSLRSYPTFGGERYTPAQDWYSSYLSRLRIDQGIMDDFQGNVDCTRLINAYSEVYPQQNNSNGFVEVDLKRIRDAYNRFPPSWNVDAGVDHNSDEFKAWSNKANSFYLMDNWDQDINFWSNEYRRAVGEAANDLYPRNDIETSIDPTWRYIINTFQNLKPHDKWAMQNIANSIIHACYDYERDKIQKYYVNAIKSIRTARAEVESRNEKCQPLYKYAMANLTLNSRIITNATKRARVDSYRDNAIRVLNVSNLLDYAAKVNYEVAKKYSYGDLGNEHFSALLESRIIEEIAYCVNRIDADDELIHNTDRYIFEMSYGQVKSNISPNTCGVCEGNSDRCVDYNTFRSRVRERLTRVKSTYTHFASPKEQPREWFINMARASALSFDDLFDRIGNYFLENATNTYLVMLYQYGIVDFDKIFEAQANSETVNRTYALESYSRFFEERYSGVSDAPTAPTLAEAANATRFNSSPNAALNYYQTQQARYTGVTSTKFNNFNIQKIRGLSTYALGELIINPLDTCTTLTQSASSDRCEKFMHSMQTYVLKSLDTIKALKDNGQKEPFENCGFQNGEASSQQWEAMMATYFHPDIIKQRINDLGRAPTYDQSSSCDGFTEASMMEPMNLAIFDIIEKDILGQDFANNPQAFGEVVRFLPFLYTQAFLSKFHVVGKGELPGTGCYIRNIGSKYRDYEIRLSGAPQCNALKRDLKEIAKNIPMSIINPKTYTLGVDWSKFFTKMDQTVTRFYQDRSAFRNVIDPFGIGQTIANEVNYAVSGTDPGAGGSLIQSGRQASELITGSNQGYYAILEGEDKDRVSHMKMILDSYKKNEKGYTFQSILLSKYPHQSEKLCAVYEKIDYEANTKIIIEKSMKKWYSFWKTASIIVTVAALLLAPFGGAALSAIIFYATLATYVGTTTMAIWKSDIYANKMFAYNNKSSSYMTTCMAAMENVREELERESGDLYNAAKMRSNCAATYEKLQQAEHYKNELAAVKNAWMIETAFYAFYIVGSWKHLKHFYHDPPPSVFNLFKGQGSHFAQGMSRATQAIKAAAEAGKVTRATKMAIYAKEALKTMREAGSIYWKNFKHMNLGFDHHDHLTRANLQAEATYLGSKGTKVWYYASAWMANKTKYNKLFGIPAPAGLLALLIFDQKVANHINGNIQNGSIGFREIDTIDFESEDGRALAETWYDESLQAVREIENAEGENGVVMRLAEVQKNMSGSLDDLTDSERYIANKIISEAESVAGDFDFEPLPQEPQGDE